MADIHVTPLHDLRPHMETRTCWCDPRIDHEEGCPAIADDESDMVLDDYGRCACQAVVIHHSADGRELVEQHGLQ